MMLVIAGTFDHQASAVEKEAALCIPPQRANAEAGFDVVRRPRSVSHGTANGVKIRQLARPQHRVCDPQDLRHFNLRPWSDLDGTRCSTRYRRTASLANLLDHSCGGRRVVVIDDGGAH